MNNSRLVITGFMATGKSTVGPLVASKLGFSFYDLDDWITHKLGQSIASIFKQHGEAFFRHYESQGWQTLLNKEQVVIATGGGTLICPWNRKYAQNKAVIFCLQASPSEIKKRLQGTALKRPLASQWQEIWKQRQGCYQTFAQQIITDNKPPLVIADEIVALWKK